MPSANSTWDFTSRGITGGTVAAVVHGDRVAYAAIAPDPAFGGIGGRVVDFILFPGVRANPIEDNGAAVSLGEQAATAFVNG